MNKELPKELEIEKSVLSLILKYPDERQETFRLLSAADFYLEAHRVIFEKCKELHRRGIQVGADTVYAELDDSQREIVQPLKLSKIIDSPPSIDIAHHSKILKDAHQRRTQIEIGNAIIKNAYKADSDKINKLAGQLIIESKDPGAHLEKDHETVFPYEVMTGAAGFYANVCGSVLEVPQTFLFMAYLTCLGAVLSRSLKIASELNTPPRLYTVLVGESAADRKSTAINKVIDHFKATIKDFAVCSNVSSAEGLQKLLKRNEGEADSPGLLLALDELSSFVNKCKIDSSILLECVNTLYEQPWYESHTKKKSIEISNGHLSLLAASTLQTYERIYNTNFIDIGFPNRVFLVVGTARRQFSIPERLSDADTEAVQQNLVGVLRHVGEGLTLTVEPDAHEFYDQWYLNHRTINAQSAA